MIILGQIISETGLDSANYPRSSEISVKLSDRKKREIGENEFNFNGKLFEKNERSMSMFKNMIDSFEAKEKELHEQISARLTDDMLIFYIPRRAPVILFLS